MAKRCVIISGAEGEVLYRHVLCWETTNEDEQPLFREALAAALAHGAIEEQRLHEYVLLIH